MADANPQQNSLDEPAMRSAEEELRRRRERGKQSQARFRKRQAQATEEMRAENDKMKAAIAEVVKATQRSDRPGLLRAVRAAADVAGVDFSGLDEERIEEDGETGGKEPASSASGSAGDSPSARQRRSNSPTNEVWEGVSRLYSMSSTSGRLSPRLDYGIWIDPSRTVKVSKPPAEIVPFIGAGRYTFSGQLYWACTEYLISLCRAVTTPHLQTAWFACSTNSRPTPQEAEHRLGRVLQHTPPMPSVRLAQALAESQREYRDSGYMAGDSPACSDEVCSLWREQLSVAYVERGSDLSVWMNLTELERHVRQQLGYEAFSRLESTIAACCITHTSTAIDQEVRAVVRLLMKNLAESYTCFGDGPRWRTDTVSALFNQKMRM
ncbi:hypothetical protein F4678DRAFT_20040 [Xylaria arbuscula]|nr:hypothetical protein F4678DRAFT_20040 [Xylaria arbuscula]